jgi:hypothetical protein
MTLSGTDRCPTTCPRLTQDMGDKIMPKATITSTTPTRRAVFRGLGLTSIAAGLAARSALAAPAAPPDAAADANPDGELITLCDRLVQLRTHEIAVIKPMDDGDDDYDPLEATDAEWDALAARLRQIDRPLTLAGAAATARCVVRHSDRCPDGDIVMIDLAEWMAIRVSEFLAGGVVA